MNIDIFKEGFAFPSGVRTTILYPIDESNLYGVRVLIDNCTRMGAGWQNAEINNTNVSIATVDPIVWLPEFLDKLLFKFSYISTLANFETIQLNDEKLTSVVYNCDVVKFKDIDEIKDKIDLLEFGTLVLFSAVKYVDLTTLSVYYEVRYKNISTKATIRDRKLGKIIE